MSNKNQESVARLSFENKMLKHNLKVAESRLKMKEAQLAAVRDVLSMCVNRAEAISDRYGDDAISGADLAVMHTYFAVASEIKEAIG